jgi:isopenicillin N synthase-like dioxygenase
LKLKLEGNIPPHSSSTIRRTSQIMASSSTPSSSPELANVVVIEWTDLVGTLPQSGCSEQGGLEEPTSPQRLESSKAVPLSSSSERIEDALRKSLGRGADGNCDDSLDLSSSSCIGLIAVRGVPGFVTAKDRLFTMAHNLVRLPDHVLEGELSDPDSLYNAGWSFGKEKLGDRPDTAKGSYYFNPVADMPGTEDDRAKYPLSYPINRWPSEGAMPGFRDAARELGCILHRTVTEIARHVDALASASSLSYGSASPDLLHSCMSRSDKVKARLLYYFPHAPDDDSPGETPKQQRLGDDSWIAWHNDSGFFTALAGDWYLDHSTGERIPAEDVDPAAGLYVASRNNGRILKVTIPEDCVAIQIGECTQIVTGGAVLATPHCVRGAASSGAGDGCCSCTGEHSIKTRAVSRVSLAVFVDTVPSFLLRAPDGCDVDRDVLLLQQVENDDPAAGGGCRIRVPPLQERWKSQGMTFGDFLSATFRKYYEWTTTRSSIAPATGNAPACNAKSEQAVPKPC